MENNIIEAEFKIVQERTLEVIATEIRTIDNHVCQVALQGAIEIGAKLEEAKEKVGHGNWENWCKENLNYSKSQAERFMKISTEYGNENSPYLSAISKTYTCTDFSISKAFRLLQVPEEEVENFAENKDVDSMTVKELEAKIKKLKEENEASEELKKERNDLEKKLRGIEAEKEKLKTEFDEYKEAQPDVDLNVDAAITELHKKELEDKESEIEKLKAKIEKSKEKEKTLKAEKDAVEAEKQKAIEQAKNEAKEEAKTLAETEAEKKIFVKVQELTAKTEEALKRAADAEKNLEIAGSEALTKRKVNINLIGTLATEIVGAIEEVKEKDPQQAAELSQKTKAFILKLVDLF